MKVKLLKKVRKRFEIHEITKLKYDAPDHYLEFFNKVGFPCYRIVDREGSVSDAIFFKSKIDALSYIQKKSYTMYRRKYSKTISSKKVWYLS